MSKENFLPDNMGRGRKIIFESLEPAKDQLKTTQETVSSVEEDKISETKKIETKEQRIESDNRRISEIRESLGLTPQEERESPVSQSLRRVREALKTKEVLASERRSELLKPKEDPSFEDTAIGYWEDGAKERLEDIKLYEGLLKNRDGFYKVHGELADDLWSRLPVLIENKKKELEEYSAIAKSLHEKKETEDKSSLD